MRMFDDMVRGSTKLQRGRVWCLECGRVQSVNSARCLRTAWPECCEYTMSLDSPEERKALKEAADG